jgi:hypothetical protein
MMWYICFFFFLVNWSYFIIGLLYWGPILEALSFYGKNIWASFKKKKKLGLIKIFGGPYFRALSFYGKIFWALFKKKKGP